jgi:hypothetical protein
MLNQVGANSESVGMTVSTPGRVELALEPSEKDPAASDKSAQRIGLGEYRKEIVLRRGDQCKRVLNLFAAIMTTLLLL